jgi:tripartite-type tricarboxylate transporter receptor subunit TctC
MIRRDLLLGAGGLAGLLAARAREAQAQGAYPSRPVTYLVGFAAGGAGDMTGRLLSNAAKDRRNAAVGVEFRPGAGATLAAGQMARARPDGYTVGLFTGSAMLTAPNLQRVPYDTLKDFTYICSFVSFPIPVYVKADSPFRTWQDLIAFARANPGRLRWGTAAVRGTAHIATEAAFRKEGLTTTFVPFGGGADAITALLGGHIEASVSSDYGPQLDAGTVRLLAESGPNKIPGFEQLPTFAELGYPIAVPSVYGIMGPAGLPAEVIAFWENLVKEIMPTPPFAEYLRLLRGAGIYDGHATFAQTIARAYASLGTAIEAAGMRAR